MTTTATSTLPPKKFNEMILVVKRHKLFPTESWNGVRKINFDEYLTIINEHKEFLPRGLMEDDPSYKQIIPYLVFENNGKYFLMQRQANASETRLQSKFSLGIGGHIREEDLGSQNIFDWAKREFHEEVNYAGNLEIEPVGILNDDSNEVGKVHLGFVLLLKGNTNHISVKSELKSGELYTLEECKAFRDRMENWSQMVVDVL